MSNNITVLNSNGDVVTLRTTDDGSGAQIGNQAIVLPLPAGASVIGSVGMDIGGIASDASANAPPVSGLGTLLSTMAFNAARRGAFVQNQSVNMIFVVLDDGTTGTPTIIPLNPAIQVGAQGGWWDTSGFLHKGRIRVYGTSGSQVGAAQV